MGTAPTSWAALPGTLANWSVRALGGGDKTLMMWGAQVQFKVQPLNFHELDHETGTDWAHKDIVGAAIYREWVGENDETLFVHGKLFPYRIGGVSAIEVFESQRRAGVSNLLIRGDGHRFGWFVCEKLTRTHTYISHEGVGQQIVFQATMCRVPVPSATANTAALFTAGGLPPSP
jgi:phage protein U